MSREWNTGDVALVQNEHGIWNCAILQVQPNGRRWVYGVTYDDAPTDSPARPLVVIDPEDREQVERLICTVDVHFDGAARSVVTDADREDMQSALREFANPKPPKPEEPTGLGAVVEDDKGEFFVGLGDHYGTGQLRWKGGRGMTFTCYDRIGVVRVLSEGVQP